MVGMPNIMCMFDELTEVADRVDHGCPDTASLEPELAGSDFTTFISEVAAVVDVTPTLSVTAPASILITCR